MSRYSTEERGSSGRPTKCEGPKFPQEEVDRALVYGEIKPQPGGDGTNVVYPSYRQLAQRYGVTSSTISDFSKRRNCLKRRKEFQQRLRIKTEQKLIEYRSEKIALTKEDSLRIIDKWLSKFEESVEAGAMRFDNASDFNLMMRLREFLQGNADSRKEIQNRITLEEIQERHKRQLRIYEESTPAERGEIGRRVIEGTEVHETFHGLANCGESKHDPEKVNQTKDTEEFVEHETHRDPDCKDCEADCEITQGGSGDSPSAPRANVDLQKPNVRRDARFLLDFMTRFNCPHCGEEIVPEQLVANPAPDFEEEEPTDPDEEEEIDDDDSI